PSSLRKKVVERLIGAVTSPVDAWLMFPLCMAMVSGFICFILFGRVYVMHVAKYKYMKRILVIAAILCSSLMVLQSCSSTSNTASTSLKRGKVTGTWVLNNITFEGVPAIAVKSLFDEASYKCFVGSTWTLTN